MKALVTGGAGFIGSHLCELLLAGNQQVEVLDDLSTGSMENLSDIQDNPSFTFTKGSVLDRELVDRAAERCDCIYHLAAAVGVKLIVERPVHTITTNIHGTEVVLEAAKKHSKKILLASTSEVYGKSDKVPFREEDDMLLGSTLFSRWSYAASKAVDEFLAFAYHDQFNLDMTVCRLFNTIGPRQTGQYGMVVPRFVSAALKGEDIVVYGDGTQTRCFCYVGDTVNAIKSLMDLPASAGRVFNIGSKREISISDLADMIIERAGSSSKKKFMDYEQAYGRQFDDMLRRVPCVEKIHKATGFEPAETLEQTIDIIIESFRSDK